MGNQITKILSSIKNEKQARLVIVGLDFAGKTTILYKLKNNQTYFAGHTVGFNVENLKLNNISFTCIDIGGGDKIKELWHEYFDNQTGIVFVIDSSDYDRLKLAKKELYRLLTHKETFGCPILILANKQDIARFSFFELEQILGLSETDRSWKIQPCIGTKGVGLTEGFVWLAEQFDRKIK